MESIKAGWSGRLTRNGTMKMSSHVILVALFPACIKICNLSDDFPVFCKDKSKKERKRKI